jgi:hypothetical protein
MTVAVPALLGAWAVGAVEPNCAVAGGGAGGSASFGVTTVAAGGAGWA